MTIQQWLLKPALKELRRIMATLQEIKDSIAANKATVEAMSGTLDSSLAFIQGINANVASLQQQVADLSAQIASGAGVTQADLDDVGAGLAEVATATDAANAKATIIKNTVDDDPTT